MGITQVINSLLRAGVIVPGKDSITGYFQICFFSFPLILFSHDVITVFCLFISSQVRLSSL